MKFRYYEIRPCVDTGSTTQSFLGKPVHHSGIGAEVHTPENAMAEAMAYLDARGGKFFWTIYGRDEKGLATAIGDFAHFSQALEVLNAILAPMAEARDLIYDNCAWGMSAHEAANEARKAADDLDDVINQSTNEERL